MTSPVVMHIDTGRTFRGGQRQLLLLAERLRRKNIRQVIATPYNSELNRRIVDIDKTELSSHSLIRKMSCSPLLRTIDEYGVNIIHAHDSESHSLGIRLKIKYSEAKLVVSRRVIFAPSSAVSRRFKYRRYVDGYIAISRAVAQSLKTAGVGDEKIVVIPSALDLENIIAARPDQEIRSLLPPRCKFLMVTAGALSIEKDFATAIEAVGLASKTCPDIGLIILGDGPEKGKLQSLAQGLEQIHFAGHREPMAPIFKACELFLLTSTSEGLNSSAIEAAACGLPLVVSDIGGLPEIAEQEYNGVLCRPGSPDEFAKAIIDLRSDDMKRKELAAHSVAKSKSFDIETTTRKTVELYNRLLAGTA